MASWLVNKNLCLMYRLRPIVGKKRALWLAGALEWMIEATLGREIYNEGD